MKRMIAMFVGAVVAGLCSVSAVAAECPRVVGFDWSIPHKIDPANADSQADSLHIWGVYEPLIWIDPDYNLLPWLAESWEANEDGTVWTFHLRQGVKFHDGSDFDASDVVYTYRRIKDPETGSPGTGQLEVFDNEGVQAVDTHTVQFTLKQPNAELPLLISGEYSLMVPEGVTTEQLDSGSHGTGPYTIENYSPDSPRTFLRRNPDYWREGLPISDCIELQGIDDPITRSAAITSGQADVVIVADAGTLAMLGGNPDVELVQTNAGVYLILWMMVDTPPFDDVRLRQALKLVQDRQAIVDLALLGYGIPMNDNPIRPTSPNAYRTDAIPQDIEKAKMLLAEAGYADGITLDLYTGATDLYPGLNAMVQAYKEMASAAGITINIVTSPSASYYDEISLVKPFGASYWFYRPPALVFPFYLTSSSWPETHWYRDDFDALIAKAFATVDPEARRELYKDAQRMLAEEGGLMTPAFSAVVAAVRKGCHYQPQVDLNRFDFAKIYCE